MQLLQTLEKRSRPGLILAGLAVLVLIGPVTEIRLFCFFGRLLLDGWIEFGGNQQPALFGLGEIES